ncbi:MAG: hypothetical protein LUF33_08510, partial [Clostridiales bacterium]|nr:hypothetical protein [Clostridiales bacterium]
MKKFISLALIAAVAFSATGCTFDFFGFGSDKSETESTNASSTTAASRSTSAATTAETSASDAIDPFENLKINYTGASPFLNVMLDSTSCGDVVNDYVEFIIDDDGYYSNGDIFTVTASYNTAAAREDNITFSSSSKTYTVSNQAEFIKSIDGLNTDDLQSELDDKLSSSTAANEGDERFMDVRIGSFKSVASKQLKSSYIISLKTNYEDEYGNTEYNRYMQIYKYVINKNEGYEDDGTNEVYVVVYADDVRELSDGTLEWNRELGSAGYDNYDSLVND